MIQMHSCRMQNFLHPPPFPKKKIRFKTLTARMLYRASLTCPPLQCPSGSDSSPHSTRPGHPRPWTPAVLHPAQYASSWQA